jgi:hypothetical protein
MQFDPANMEQRRQLAEQLLSSLVYALEGLARDQGYLQHRINLPFSVAASHVRLIENHDAEQAK